MLIIEGSYRETSVRGWYKRKTALTCSELQILIYFKIISERKLFDQCSLKHALSALPKSQFTITLHFIIVFNNTWYHTVTDSIQFNKFENFAFNVLEVSGRVESS